MQAACAQHLELSRQPCVGGYVPQCLCTCWPLCLEGFSCPIRTPSAFSRVPSVNSPLIPICSSFCFVHIRDLARITEPLPYCAPEGAPEVRTERHPSLKPCICEFLTLQCPPHSGDSTRDCLGTWVDSWLYCLFPGIWEPTLGCPPCLHGPRCLSLSNGRDLSLPAAECLPEEPALKEDPESRG